MNQERQFDTLNKADTFYAVRLIVFGTEQGTTITMCERGLTTNKDSPQPRIVYLEVERNGD